MRETDVGGQAAAGEPEESMSQVSDRSVFPGEPGSQLKVQRLARG